MSYTAKETSEDLGNPIELYLFSDGTVNYCYTSADEDQSVTIDGVPLIFVSTNPLERSKPEYSEESESKHLTINMPWDNPAALRFAQFVPPSTFTLGIY